MSPSSAPAADPALENVLELLFVLESVQAQLCGEGPHHLEAILLTVDLPDRVLVGADFARLWLAPVGRQKELHGLAGRELLASRPGARPRILLDEPLWRFASFASGPLTARFTPLAPEDRPPAQEAVSAAVRAVERFRHEVERVVAQLGEGPAWERCVVCSPLPALCFFPWRGEGPPPERREVRAHYLEIVGAPLFNDFGSSREWCLKRCPLCATHYLWKSDYEYLVNGATETDTTLARLTPEETQPIRAKVEEALRRGQR